MGCELNGGYINNTQIDGPDNIIKRFAGEERIGSSRNKRFLRELRALRYYAGTEVPVPKLLGSDFRTRCLSLSLLSGLPLDDYIRNCEKNEKDTILFQAGEILRRIHSHLVPAISWRTVLNQFLSQTKQVLTQCMPILETEKINEDLLFSTIVSNLDTTSLAQQGTTHVHRDYWLNNLIYNQGQIVGVIDWELAGIGSPYEDFAIVDLWICREHSESQFFWQGYGYNPHQPTVSAWLLGRCLQFLATTNLSSYLAENPQGFYHNKITTIKQIIKELS